jgi:hypothetical protein
MPNKGENRAMPTKIMGKLPVRDIPAYERVKIVAMMATKAIHEIFSNVFKAKALHLNREAVFFGTSCK